MFVESNSHGHFPEFSLEHTAARSSTYAKKLRELCLDVGSSPGSNIGCGGLNGGVGGSGLWHLGTCAIPRNLGTNKGGQSLLG